jgi:hypothetical protein
MAKNDVKIKSPRYDIKSMTIGKFTINEGHMLEEFATGFQKNSTSFLQKAAMSALPIALSLMFIN